LDFPINCTTLCHDIHFGYAGLEDDSVFAPRVDFASGFRPELNSPPKKMAGTSRRGPAIEI